MFQRRLVREDDVDLTLKCFAYLIRRWGLPERPPVPSPLHKSQGLETLLYSLGDTRTPSDWAQDNFGNVLYWAGLQNEALTLVAADEPQIGATILTTGELSYDLERVGEQGRYVTQIMLQLADMRMAEFEPGFAPTGPQKALILLSACAFMRHGFSLTHCLSVLGDEFREWAMPSRAVEAQLVFAACLALRLRRQTPEQIIATYGSVMSPSVRRKVRPVCRQFENYEPELKLLQTLPDPTYASTFGMPRGSIRPGLKAQPQRISWTY